MLIQTCFLIQPLEQEGGCKKGCVLNMYADDVIVYTSATSKDELESRLQVCIDNISNWYSMNKLCINKKKSNVMVIGSKWQLKIIEFR